MTDDMEIVADEEQSQTEPGAQVRQQVEYLGLDGESSDDAGSSATTKSGRVASARAIAMR
jgi:hypothetical protein